MASQGGCGDHPAAISMCINMTNHINSGWLQFEWRQLGRAALRGSAGCREEMVDNLWVSSWGRGVGAVGKEGWGGIEWG